MKLEPNHKITLSPDFNPLCVDYVPDPVEEELWMQAEERRKEREKSALMDRAKACAEALKNVFAVGEMVNEQGAAIENYFSYASEEEIAAIIIPFLNP